MNRTKPYLLLAMTSLALAACATSNRPFEGVGPDGETGGTVRYRLSAEGRDEGTIALTARGERNREHEGLKTDVFEVSLTVDNLSADDIRLPLDAIEARDDAGRTWAVSELYTPDTVGEGPLLVVPAGQRMTLSAVFDSGASGALATTGSVTLGWKYRFRGKDFDKRTRFIPAPRTVYRDTHHVHFGVGYRHGYWLW